MENIQDFIQTATQQLGIGEKETRSATGGLLQYLKKEVQEGDFKELLKNIPGAESLMSEAPKAAAAKAGAGGMLGDLAGKAASAMGAGEKGSATGLMSVLQGAGLDLGKAGTFISLFTQFAKQKGGSDVIGRILSKLPNLGSGS